MFKAGDKVKLKYDCSGLTTGVVYTLDFTTFGKLYAQYNPLTNDGCSCQENWILVRHKTIKELYKDLTKPYKGA